jgi:hypothetical protein
MVSQPDLLAPVVPNSVIPWQTGTRRIRRYTLRLENPTILVVTCG